MADLFDLFNGSGALASHTSDSGHSWADPDSLFTITGGSVTESGTDSDDKDYPLSNWTPPGTDYAVKMVVGASYPATATTNAFGPVVRAQGSSEDTPAYYLQMYETGGAGAAIIIWKGASSSTNLAIVGSLPLLAANDVVEFRVAGAGATVTLTALVNGTVVLTATDTSGTRITTAGQAGFRVTNAGAGGTDMCRTVWAGAIGGPTETVAPSTPTVAWLATQSFTAAAALPNDTYTWSATHGSITGSAATETYTAPSSGSTDTVTWTSVNLPTQTASATLSLVDTATQLAIRTQPPGSTSAGGSFGLIVTAEDSSSSVVTTYTGNVTVAISSNPSSGTLSGTLTQAAIAGVATFAGLSINNAGTGYTLVATASGLTSATTGAFNITSGTATAFSLGGPSSGFVHNASTNFTFTPNANYTGAITPAMSGLAGTWSPSSLTWSGSAVAQTATFTPDAVGIGSANGTASPSLTQPSAVTYDSNAQTVAVSPAVLQESSTTTVTFTGGGTFWESTAPTFGATGVSGISCGSVAVNSNTSATCSVTTSTASGTITWTDSTTGAQATETVSATATVLSIVTGLTTGLSTVGYAVVNPDDSTFSAYTTTGVLERGSGSGNYGALVSIPGTGYAEIRWSVGNAAPFYPDVVEAPVASSGGGGGGGGSSLTGYYLSGSIALSPAPTASAFTITLSPAISSSMVVADLVGQYVTFLSGANQAAYRMIRSAVINSTTSVAVALNAAFPVTPSAADALIISG